MPLALRSVLLCRVNQQRRHISGQFIFLSIHKQKVVWFAVDMIEQFLTLLLGQVGQHLLMERFDFAQGLRFPLVDRTYTVSYLFWDRLPRLDKHPNRKVAVTV